MNERKKISKKKRKKDHRRETITLDGFFGNKWRIAEIDKDQNRYALLIYGNKHRYVRRFATNQQLLGILQGVFLCQLLDPKVFEYGNG